MHLESPKHIDALLKKAEDEHHELKKNRLNGTEKTLLRRYHDNSLAGAGNSPLSIEVAVRVSSIRQLLGYAPIEMPTDPFEKEFKKSASKVSRVLVQVNPAQALALIIEKMAKEKKRESGGKDNPAS